MPQTSRARRRKNKSTEQASIPPRTERYRQLKNPFKPQQLFSKDQISAIHQTALRVLEELGIKVLLPEGRYIFKQAGARVDDNSGMVFIGNDIVEQALNSAPRSFLMRGGSPEWDQVFEPGRLLFAAGGGCPNASDLERGRRPGSLRDFEEAIKLQQSFDVIHKLNLSAEPQDIPINLRHYAIMRAQLTLGSKPFFTYARGQNQVLESFEMIRLALDLDEQSFTQSPWVSTVINTNSPRQLDVPMTQGIIDFAKYGQMTIITPFCLAGAMAPITTAGALTLQHAEALAGITLSQLVKPGAPVAYGSFTSNVDMRSGSPAFGTPEHLKGALGSGQLARHIGMPWRSAVGVASNMADAQAAQETLMSLWGAVMSGATIVLHSAGWMEGGLTFGYEKFINDLENLQTIAELCQSTAADDAAMAFEAIKDVEPGGHFFSTQHTMERYQDAFYDPLIADLSNYETWKEKGEQSSRERATATWKKVLAEYEPPKSCEGAAERLERFIADRAAKGGAWPQE